METLLKNLNNCIDRQRNLYRKLLDLFLEERRAILASDLEDLNNVIIEKELILQNIRQEEFKRRQTGDEIAAQLGIDPETLTISQLSRKIKEPYASEIQHSGARLQTLIDEIQVASDRNRSLCLQALQFVGSSIKLLTTLTHPNQVYHATGRVQNEGRIGRMLSGAV
jgi:FlgN protein